MNRPLHKRAFEAVVWSIVAATCIVVIFTLEKLDEVGVTRLGK